MNHRIAVALAIAAAGTVSAQTPSFSTRIESVRVDVLVTQNGRPVTGLAPDNFEVRDNGVPQKIDLASYDEIPLNVVLALDLSGSLDAPQLRELRSAGKALLFGLKATDQAALVTFSHIVAERSALTPDLNRIRRALDEASPSGQTSLIDAAFAGMMVGESDAGRSLLIVFTDGVDSTSWLSADSVLEVAKRSDVIVYGVEIGRARFSFLKDLTSATGGRTIAIESTQDLDKTFEDILGEFRHRYLLSYSPQNVAAGGWHSLAVTVKGRNFTVRARPGYLSDK